MLKRLIKIAYLIVMIVISAGQLIAGKINFNVDDATFIEADGKNRWEFYYSFDELSLKYKNSDKGLLGELFIHVAIYSNIKLEQEKKWIVSHILDNSDSESAKTMVGQKDFILQPGQYKINVFIQDVNDSTTTLELNYELIIRSQHKDKINLSSLQIAQHILPEDNTQNSGTFQWNESFKKNGYFVVPVPSLIFIAERQKLNSYIEIYNPDKLNKQDFNIKYYLVDSYHIERDRKFKTLKSDSNFIFDINEMDISALETGTYYLRTIVVYPYDEPVDSFSVEKKFYIINSTIVEQSKEQFYESAIFERSEFASLTDEQTAIEIAKIKPIASYQEIEQFDKLTTSEAKKRLLYRFWTNRDTDTNTVFNEELFKYRELIKFADRFFSYSKTRGWQTDRGRVLMKYGMPSEREQHPFFGETSPYESWFYTDIQGGIYFHFVDMTGLGRYDLVHSTAQNEIQFEDWYNEYVLKQRSNYDNQNEY